VNGGTVGLQFSIDMSYTQGILLAQC